MRILVEELRYHSLDIPFVGTLKPYAHQLGTLDLVREALRTNSTVCIENASVTGGGKTLANFAATILDDTRTIGVYPTNELLLDQHGSIRKHLINQLLILDSEGLDDIMAEEKHMRSHAHALAWATGDDMRTALLTNPDVLYLAMYSLYGRMFSTFAQSYGARIFQYVLSNYPVIAFDEFHLYSTKQIANAAFIVGTARELAPDKPHIFIFSSATPQDQFKRYLQRLRLQAIPVTDSPADTGRIVCEPIEVNPLPANLLNWQGGDTLRGALDEILNWADRCNPPARGVFIVDSVYEAKRIAAVLRERYGVALVGEVHGYMDPDARADALQRRFSVGTTTIDVGVDLTDNKSKEFLVCEARSPAQAIQRIGRLGRHGREPSTIKVPNRVWLAVPEYVYNYIKSRKNDGTTITRKELGELLDSAYLGQENFNLYTEKYSPLEAVAACERILPQYFEDIKPLAEEKLHRLVPTLYGKKPPADQEQAEKSYSAYRWNQRRTWSEFGIEIKGPRSKSKRYYLSDLESFRGGMESDFTVAIYDDLDERLGLTPVKTYNLPFVLRRTQYDELTKQQFIDLLKLKHPKSAEGWIKDLERQQHLFGYLHVYGLVEGRANQMYFEVGKGHIENRFHQVIRLEGLAVGGDNMRLSRGEGSINGQLKKRKLNCWISELNSFKLSESLHLPPLFAIYPLHALNAGGKYDEWSIAFGLDAFLLTSISKKLWWPKSRFDNTAIIL
jgi:CRISPR-associated helicase Cas3